MQALIILGSRDHEGRTARAAAAMAAGLESQSVQVERVFLPERAIERCRQCEASGWGICRTESRCVIEDDFEEIRRKVRQADRLVVANPVYFADLSESLRGFLDRLRRICRHETDGAGIRNKPVVGICVAGGGGGGAPSAALRLEEILLKCGFEVADMVPVRRQNLEHKLEVLRLTGAWLAGYTPAD
jgi:multimeric flavodoxin WrbA